MRMARLVAAGAALTLTLAGCTSGERPTLVETASGQDTPPDGESEDVSQSVVIDVVDGDPQIVEDEPAESVPEPEDEPPADESSTGDPLADVPIVVYDTDMGPDIDDALALAMLHSYEKRGMIELGAVTVSRDSPLGARYTDAVNTFYGRPDIPIGVYRGETKEFDEQGKFINLAGQWENDVADSPIPDGFRVQRQVLVDAAAAGRSVIFIQTGFSGNLSTLIDSGADDISDRSGNDLVADHSSLLSIMAGATSGFVEFNVEYDVASARNLMPNWPGAMVQSPFELGDGIHYPYTSIRDDLNWVDRHPVKEAYEFNDLGWHQDAPPFYNMKTWDLTSVLYAVEPDAGYFVLSDPGKVTIDGSGRTGFSVGSDGLHRKLETADRHSEAQRNAIVDRMIELVSDRP